MKRLTAIVLFVVLVFSFVACSDVQNAEKYCWNCGERIANEASFCEHCGAKINIDQDTNESYTTDESENVSNSESSGDSSVDKEESQFTKEESHTSDIFNESSDESQESSTPEENKESSEAEVTHGPEEPIHEHSYSKKTTVPTCTKNGYTTYTCSCGDVYTANETAAKGHNYSEKVTKPTCTENGYTTYTCSCGDSYTGNETAAKGHAYSKKITSPTCTTQGYTTYTCSCGDTYKSNYVNAAHNYSNYKCTKCGTIDVSHSFEYLSDWLLNNGTTYGEYVYIQNYFDDDVISIKYYPEEGDIVFAYSSYDNGAFVLTNLYIYEDSENVNYISGSETSRIIGKIPMLSHTTTYPLSYDSCQPGEYETEYNMLENTRIRINYLLTGVEYMLEYHEVGITIKDIGFVSFDA